MELSEGLTLIQLAQLLYKSLKDLFLNKGESDLAKKFEESKEEIIQKLEEVVKGSKIVFDQQFNIMTKGNVTIQQNYYESPQYHRAFTKYAFDTAAASGSFLMGRQGAQLNFPDPKGYLAMMYKLNRVADALKKQTEAISKPKVKIEPKDRRTDSHSGVCNILIDNRGEETITLKKILFKWEYVNHEGEWYGFARDYDKEFFKGDRDIIKFEVPRHSIEEKAPKEMDDDQIKRIFFLINAEIEVQYEDSSDNKYIKPIKIGKFL